jgi:hypothetical protein
VVDLVDEQPLASVTVNVYVPADRLFWFLAVDAKEPGPDHDHVNGEVPPIGLTEMYPFEPPKHEICTTEVQVALNEVDGSVRVTCVDVVLPLASVTPTV